MFGRLGCFLRTILGRMILFVVIPTFIVVALTVALAARSGFENLREASEDLLEATANLTALQIERQNSKAVLCVQRMAEAQMSGMFGDRESSITFARTVLENYPEITGSYFGYEPNADQQDQDSLNQIRAESMDANGRFIPYWFVKPDQQKARTIELEPLVDMESSLYYSGCKEAFEKAKKPLPMITEPYVYQGKMIVEQTYPIVIDGRFAGVAGVDRALADVERSLRQVALEENIDLFLISSRGRFIAATTDPERTDQEDTRGLLKTQEVATSKYGSLFSEMLRDRTAMWTRDPVDGLRYYFVPAHIPTGNWTVILRKSHDAIVAPIWSGLARRIGLVILGMICIVGLLITVTNQLRRRVRLAADVAERVADGNLTQEINPGSCRDETGDLLRSICRMTGNLNSLVGNVKQASIQLNSTATELAATSREQQKTSSSFGASATQIAAAVKQISSTTNELVQTMEEVSQAASTATELATSGQSGLQNMDANMRVLEDATSSFGEKLGVINEKAANITGIVTTITKVADQTNLLSVNAAIEAEKAGEYGVGFLVVAREIRRLADQTASATLDIEHMVQQMQSAVAAGVMEMDRFAEQVRHNVGDVARVSQQLSEIIEMVTANTVRFARVNESMQSQSQGADQINSAMSQLSSHASHTAEAATEYANAANELQEAIASLKSSIASFQLRTDQPNCDPSPGNQGKPTD